MLLKQAKDFKLFFFICYFQIKFCLQTKEVLFFWTLCNYFHKRNKIFSYIICIVIAFRYICMPWELMFTKTSSQVLVDMIWTSYVAVFIINLIFTICCLLTILNHWDYVIKESVQSGFLLNRVINIFMLVHGIIN